MSLSHTHHHPFPGCPISRPKSARTEDREEGGQPQHKQKVGGNEQGELWAHSSASVETLSSQQGEQIQHDSSRLAEP